MFDFDVHLLWMCWRPLSLEATENMSTVSLQEIIFIHLPVTQTQLYVYWIWNMHLSNTKIFLDLHHCLVVRWILDMLASVSMNVLLLLKGTFRTGSELEFGCFHWQTRCVFRMFGWMKQRWGVRQPRKASVNVSPHMSQKWRRCIEIKDKRMVYQFPMSQGRGIQEGALHHTSRSASFWWLREEDWGRKKNMGLLFCSFAFVNIVLLWQVTWGQLVYMKLW